VNPPVLLPSPATGPDAFESVVLRYAQRHLRRAQKAGRSMRADGVQQVHDVRISLKRLRALWRMVSAQAPRTVAREEADRLRSLSHTLAHHRDADVLAESARDLRPSAVEDADRAALAWLLGHAQRAARKPRAPLLQTVLAALPAAIPRLRGALADRGGWGCVEPGLRETYRAARRLGADCGTRSTDARFHAWRRRCKDLMYQLEVLELAKPAWAAQPRGALARIARWLGDAHNLVTLLERCAVAERPLSPAFRSRLRRRIRYRYRAAMALGRATFLARPGDWLLSLRGAFGPGVESSGAIEPDRPDVAGFRGVA
jgi:CHAD domain-containing protein